MNAENSRISLLKRNMRVYYGHYDFDTCKPHPMIRLRGKYLVKFGFNVGDIITVDIDVGQITIRKMPQSIRANEPGSI